MAMRSENQYEAPVKARAASNPNVAPTPLPTRPPIRMISPPIVARRMYVLTVFFISSPPKISRERSASLSYRSLWRPCDRDDEQDAENQRAHGAAQDGRRPGQDGRQGHHPARQVGEGQHPRVGQQDPVIPGRRLQGGERPGHGVVPGEHVGGG